MNIENFNIESIKFQRMNERKNIDYILLSSTNNIQAKFRLLLIMLQTAPPKYKWATYKIVYHIIWKRKEWIFNDY